MLSGISPCSIKLDKRKVLYLPAVGHFLGMADVLAGMVPCFHGDTTPCNLPRSDDAPPSTFVHHRRLGQCDVSANILPAKPVREIKEQNY